MVSRREWGMVSLTLSTELSLRATSSRSDGSGLRTLLLFGITGLRSIRVSLTTVSVGDRSFAHFPRGKRWLIWCVVPHLRHGLRVAPQAEKPYLDPESKTRKEALQQEETGKNN